MALVERLRRAATLYDKNRDATVPLSDDDIREMHRCHTIQQRSPFFKGWKKDWKDDE